MSARERPPVTLSWCGKVQGGGRSFPDAVVRLESDARRIDFMRWRKTTMESIHDTFRRQGLTRPREGRVLGGVIAGLGRRLGIDPWPARLLFILLLMIIPGSQLVIYPILWVLMPSD
jgi:phage shock protein C